MYYLLVDYKSVGVYNQGKVVIVLNKNIMKKITYTILGLAVLTPSLASACLSDWGLGGGYGMMGYGGGSAFMVIGGIVWTVVGILAGVWLWQNINRK